MAVPPPQWMWSEALEMLERAERLHRRFAEPILSEKRIAWEPPVDILETEHEVLVFTALPGVAPEKVQAVIDDCCLVISGTRLLPRELRTARIHRLELPQGYFERRVPLPPGKYDLARRDSVNGILIVTVLKSTA
jgi:HSP20 family molecular chaperone IbpA